MVKNITNDELWTALRIFGVYSHAEMDRMGSFWEAVSRDLGRQGQRYRDRYVQRSAQKLLRAATNYWHTEAFGTVPSLAARMAIY